MRTIQRIRNWINRIGGRDCAAGAPKGGFCVWTDTVNTAAHCKITTTSGSQQRVEFESTKGSKTGYLHAHARPKKGIQVTSNDWIRDVFVTGRGSKRRHFDIKPDLSSSKKQSKLFIDIYKSNSKVGSKVPDSDITNQSHVFPFETLEVKIRLG